GAIIGGETVTLTGGAAAFQTASVGTSKPVDITGLTLGGARAANYQLASTAATATADITAVVLTPSVTVSNKPYDATTAATIATRTLFRSGAIIGGETVTLTGGAAAFQTASVGTSKPVNITGLTLGGA